MTSSVIRATTSLLEASLSCEAGRAGEWLQATEVEGEAASARCRVRMSLFDKLRTITTILQARNAKLQ